MLPQIKRLGIAFAIFISLFLIARTLLVPKSFGEKGHYRALSVSENAAKPLMYAGKDGCKGCHDDMIEKKAASPHAGLNCEVCHGPCLVHVNAPDSIKPNKPQGRAFCGKCHFLNAARKISKVNQIDGKEHNVDQNCTECHNPHSPWENLK
jgi:hypothetical protein